MKSFQVRVGGFYVNDNKGLVREIRSETGDGDVQWQAYELRDGAPSPGGSGLCSKNTIFQWATREATEEEISMMQTYEARTNEMKKEFELLDGILKALPDEMLIAEAQRRGLTITKK
jgi:hypothetical protein